MSSPLRARPTACPSSMPLRLMIAIVTLLLAGATTYAQTDLSNAQGTGCTENKAGACDKPAFIRTFNAAKTVAIETKPEDAMATGQLTKMTASYGKTPAAGAPADLTLALQKVDTAGVLEGPGGTQLAILRIYGPNPGGPNPGGPNPGGPNPGGPNPAGGHGQLIWVESFSGQMDMMWPAAVGQLIQQFKGELGKRK